MRNATAKKDALNTNSGTQGGYTVPTGTVVGRKKKKPDPTDIDEEDAPMKTITRYLVKTAKGYVTKDDGVYTDADDTAKQYDDPAEAQGKADDEDKDKPADSGDDAAKVEEVEVEEPEEGEGDKDKDGEEPFVPKASAKHAAMLYQNAKDITDYISTNVPTIDHPGMAEGLQKIHDKHVPAMQAELKDLLHKHHGTEGEDPDTFMEKVCKGMETDSAGPTTETGEAQLVDGGQVAPNDVSGDANGDTPPDKDTEEINERYQDQKSKKWYTRKIGEVRRGLNNRLYVVKMTGGVKKDMMGNDDTPAKKKDVDEPVPMKALDDNDVEAVKDASEYMKDASEDDQIPKGHQYSMKSHGKRLGQVHKALTNAGKIQHDGGRGTTLTDEGTAGNKGSMKDKGEPQTDHGTPSGKVSYEGGDKDVHELKSWEKELVDSMESLRREKNETRKVAVWSGLLPQ